MSDDTFFVENKNLQHQLQENKNVSPFGNRLNFNCFICDFFLALSYN